MILTSMVVAVIAVVVGLAGLWWVRRERGRRLVEEHTIAPEELHRLRELGEAPRLFDVRLPLDVLAYSEIIPGAVRVAPKDVLADPSLIPKDEITVVYCTCPGDETSREILGKVLAAGYEKATILRGGLAAWKEKGYPVEPYTMSFRLDTPA